MNHEGIAEARATGGQPVEMRGFEKREVRVLSPFLLHHAKRVEPVVIGHHDHDIGLLRLRDPGEPKKNQEQDDRGFHGGRGK